MTTPDAYDSPWKLAITRYFADFMAFFFPAAHAAIDWDQAPVVLEQELAELQRDAAFGRRLADKLVQVALHGAGPQWVLVHLEVQARHEQRFAERLFTYHYRIYDRYRRPVASLVLLADRSATWRPASFGYSLLGCTLRLAFPVVKLGDFGGRIAQLLEQHNPFALVTAAHLLTAASKGRPARRAAQKWRLIRLLLKKKWPPGRIMDLFQVIDWMMRLPPELARKVRQKTLRLEREGNMVYVTSFERLARQEGREEGREAGLQEGQRTLLSALLRQRFGALPQAIVARIGAAGAEQLLAWGVAALDAPTLVAVFGPDH